MVSFSAPTVKNPGAPSSPRDRKGLLRLIRYGARQCFSQDRLSELPDGRIHHRLSRPWGKQRAITLQPTALLHRLTALIPAPCINLTRYHGCFAPNASRRHEVINLAFHKKARARRRPSGDTVTEDQDAGLLQPLPALPPVERSIPWAELLQRTFKIDVLQCPRCRGRLSIIAFITDLIVVGKILAHLRLPTEVVEAVGYPSHNAFYDLQLNAYFCHIATDSKDNGVI